jgi:methionine-gamma-lyase
MNDSRHIETQAIHAGRVGDPAHGSLATPIHQTSTFVFDDAAQGGARFAGEEGGYVYSRLGNPTVRELEQRMAVLEGTEDAIAFASGMGAISAVLLGLLRAGDHLVSTAQLYGCTHSLVDEQLRGFGIDVTLAPEVSEAAIEAAITPRTRMIYVETPVNPGLEVLDLAAIARMARLRGIVTVCDNTFMTPVLQRPARHGIDLVVHSATKYLNGHGDVIAGIVCGDAARLETLRMVSLKNFGAVLSPHDAWLVLRGLKTLPLRVARHNENAARVAEFLAGHPAARQVCWPGLPGHRAHRLLGTQMRGAGAVIAFEPAGGFHDAVRFLDALSLCRRAVSLGDVETLVQHPASMTHSTYTPEDRRAAGISDSLVRIAVGLEHADDIIADLDQALAPLAGGERHARTRLASGG